VPVRVVKSRDVPGSEEEGPLHMSAVGRADATPFPGRREPRPEVLRRRARRTPRHKACLDDPDWSRWPDGFSARARTRWFGAGSQMGIGRVPDLPGASRCRRDIFHGTRTPLTAWFGRPGR